MKNTKSVKNEVKTNESKVGVIKSLSDKLMGEKSQWGMRLLFFIFSFVILGVVNQDVMYQIFWRSYFLYDADWACTTIGQSGGLLLYISLFLNTFLHTPLIGGLFFAFFLTLLQYGLSKCFDKENRLYWLTYLPSILLIVAFLMPRYEVFWKFERGYYFASVLGLLLSVGLYALMKQFIKNEIVGFLVGVVLSAVLYPFIGFFSILPLLYYSLQGELKMKIAGGVAFVALFFILPIPTSIWATEFYLHVLFNPMSDDFFMSHLIVSLIAVLSVVVLAILSGIGAKIESRIMAVATLLSFISLIVLVSTPANKKFRSDLKLIELARNYEWRDILKETRKMRKMDHFENTFRLVALVNTNHLIDKAFDAPMPLQDDAHRLLSVVYRDYLFFYSSLFSTALQFNMEMWTSYGDDFERLKRFVVLALLNGEDELAKRYIEVMRKTKSMDFVVDQFEKYVGNSKKILEVPMYKNLVDHTFQEKVALDGCKFFQYCYLQYRDVDAANMERRLLMDLALKSLDVFVRDLSIVPKDFFSPFPVYFQEALALKTIISNDESWIRRYPVERSVALRVEQIYNDVFAHRNEDRGELGLKWSKKYQGSYAYYFLFNNDNTDIIMYRNGFKEKNY